MILRYKQVVRSFNVERGRESVFENMGTDFSSLEILQGSEACEDQLKREITNKVNPLLTNIPILRRTLGVCPCRFLALLV